MPGTYVVDMRDYIREDPAKELTPPVMRVRDFVGNIVRAATATPRREFITGLPCRRRPGNRQCLGTIAVRKVNLPEPFVFWKCAACRDNGRIAGFLGCLYDLGAFTKRRRNGEEQRHDIALAAGEYRSWISGDMISYDRESMRIIYSATASKRGIVVSVPDTERKNLCDSTAADANRESNRKRQGNVYAIFEKLDDILEKPSARPSVRSRGRRSDRSPRPSRPVRDPRSSYAHGFFSAIVAGPMVMPAKWLQRFLTEHESVDELNKSARSVMDAYNKVAEQLLERREQFGSETLAVARRDADGSALIGWQRGFLDAINLNPDEWAALLSTFKRNDILKPLAMISEFSQDPNKRNWLTDQELRENIGRALGVMTARLWEAYRAEPMVELEFEQMEPRGAEPTAARNAPCPCGSGKKFKRCCGSTLRVV
jgi:yecA family protein